MRGRCKLRLVSYPRVHTRRIDGGGWRLGTGLLVMLPVSKPVFDPPTLPAHGAPVRVDGRPTRWRSPGASHAVVRHQENGGKAGPAAACARSSLAARRVRGMRQAGAVIFRAGMGEGRRQPWQPSAPLRPAAALHPSCQQRKQALFHYSFRPTGVALRRMPILPALRPPGPPRPLVS